MSESKMNNLLSDSFMIPDQWECVICKMILKDPVLTRCGHRFCDACLKQWIRKNRSCPTDGKELNEEDIFPDNYTKRDILKSTVQCPNRGCLQPIPLIKYEEHIVECQRNETNADEDISMNCEEQLRGKDAEVCCPFADVGCKFTSVSNTSLADHLEEKTSEHLAFVLEDYKRVKDSFNFCQERCVHIGGCSRIDHTKDGELKLPFYINDIYEKLINLDQRTRENGIKTCNLERKIMNEERKDGVGIWKVTNFDEKISKLMNEPNTVYVGPAFSSSFFGYKFRIRMILSSKDSTTLAFVLHLMKGESDVALSWPYKGTVTLVICHPNSEENLPFHHKISGISDSDAFQRPILQINCRGFVLASGVKVSHLRNSGFISNNTLTLMVRVKHLEDFSPCTF